ncbi:tetratricopeptide repeat protein [Xylanibacter muris]|uniref:Tetratricopeptide repeat protein n=1 Tax=Xylanibacter muris TaxID=2736290 RepID=A0ABX2AM37_9BACT|nr:tetratricopeptide repeat protein [Xylanibacter muris]NPD91289.1 tetratricopeptide repeat protein [Xylanibacter muris]
MTKLILKIIFILSIPLSALTGCNKGDIHKRLAQVDSLLIKNMPDSAMKMLEQIPEKNISDKEARAYYNLLMTQTRYRLYLPITSDSLINISIDYYKQEQGEKLARSYYYKGITLHEIGRVKEAVVCLKKAETLASDINDNALNNKILESLDFVNELAGEYSLALEYAKKNMELSIKCKNDYWLAFAFNGMALCYGNLGYKDSAIYYINKCIPILNHVPTKEKYIILNNIGYFYRETNDTIAFTYLEKAYRINPHNTTLDNLAYLYAKTGNFTKADSLWKKALATKSLLSRIKIMEAMLKHKEQFGFHEEASNIAVNLLKLRDSLKSKRTEEKVKDLQIEFDKSIEHTKKTTVITVLKLIVIIIMTIAIVITTYYIYNIKKTKKHYLEAQKHIEKYTEIIDSQKKDTENYKENIEKLNEMITTLQDKKSIAINNGNVLYGKIKEGGNTIKWDKNDFECAIDYYSTIDAQFVINIKTNYNNLSPKYQFFMILENEGKDNEELKKIYGIGDSSIRSIRSRIKSKKKD